MMSTAAKIFLALSLLCVSVVAFAASSVVWRRFKKEGAYVFRGARIEGPQARFQAIAVNVVLVMTGCLLLIGALLLITGANPATLVERLLDR